MLSIFPTLFAYNMAVPLVFRIVIGLSFILFGYANYTRNKEGKIGTLESFKIKPGKVWLRIIAATEIIGGVLVVTGLYTQIIALIFSIFLLIGLLAKSKKPDSLSLTRTELLLLLLVTASLLFLGPGFFAIDLPL